MGSDMSDAEAEQIIRQISQGRHTVHTFLDNVAQADDTTKVGNITPEELGAPTLPVRTYKELAVFCKEVAGMEYFKEYFKKMSEVQTSTSLSKEGFLIKAAITTFRMEMK